MTDKITEWFHRQSSWIESQQASILSAAVIILFANVASAGFGLIKNRVIISVYFGLGNILDSYWVAFRLPEFIYQLIVLGTLSASFVPLFTKLYKNNEEEAFELSRQVMLVLVTLFGLASIVIFIFAPQFTHLFTAKDFDGERFDTAVRLTRIMLLSQLFFSVSGFTSAMLQSVKRFVIPAFAPVFYNLGTIVFVLLFHNQLGLEAAAWGTVFGAFLHFAIQIPLLRKCGFRFFAPFKWQPQKLKELLILAGPRTITMAVEQLTLWSVTFFGTSISGGSSLTLITASQQLMNLPIRFFGVPIAQASLPFLSAAHDDPRTFRQMVYRSLRQIAFFSAPASSLLLILRVAVVRIAYGASDFPWKATLTTAESLGILALSIPIQAFQLELERSYYAMNNTIIPFLSSTMFFLSTMLFGWYFVIVLQWGVPGMAWALTVASFLETGTQLAIFLVRTHFQDSRPLWVSLGKIGAATLLMTGTLFVLQRLFDLYVFETSRVAQLVGLTLIVGTIGSLVYLGFCLLLRIEEITIVGQIWNKVRYHWNKVVKTTPEFVESTGVSQVDQLG